MQVSTKSIRGQALIEICKTVNFDNSSNNLSWDIVLTELRPEQKKKKKKSKNKRSAFACKSINMTPLYLDVCMFIPVHVLQCKQ